MAAGRSSGEAPRRRHGARRSCAGALRPGAPRPRVAPRGRKRRAGLRLRRSSWTSRHHSSRCQERSHFLQADPHAAFYCSERDLHPARDLDMRVAAKVGKLESFSLSIRQLVKSFLDLLAFEVARNRLPDIGNFGRWFHRLELKLATNTSAPAEPVACAFALDRATPV